MTNYSKYALALLLSIGITHPCLAIMIADPNAGILNGTDVGSTDDLLATALKAKGPVTLTSLPNSGEATETEWVDLVLTDLGTDTTNLSFLTKFAPAPIFATDMTGVFASDITTNPTAIASYFIIKNARNWALFENNANMNWAVFKVSLLPKEMNINDITVSHVSLFSNNNGSVPEPSVLVLMGLGLLVAAITRRRKLDP